MNNQGKTLSKIMNIVDKVGTVILMNLMFLVSCIPVVTIGAAWSGLYSSIRFTIRKEGWFAGFKEGFKTCFLRNTLGTVYGLLVAGFSLNNIIVGIEMLKDNAAMSMAITLLVVFGLLLLAALLFMTAMVPINLYIRTNYDRALKNTIYLIVHAPLQILGVTALICLPVFQFIFLLGDFIVFCMIFLAVYFTLCGYVATILLKNPLIRILQKERAAGNILEED